MRRLPLRSPPRMRGKVLDTVIEHAFDGITPACAGKRNPSATRIWPDWDHPRVCGEKATHRGSLRSKEGSPPRVRGKEPDTELRGHAKGITPACAGKSIFLYRCVVLCYILFRAIRQSTP